jgi:hypothetical protein
MTAPGVDVVATVDKPDHGGLCREPILWGTANCCRVTRRTARSGSAISASLGEPVTRSRIRASNLPVLTTPALRAELRSTKITVDVEQIPLQKLAARRQHPLLLSHLRLHMHWLQRANPHHPGNPSRIVASFC